jgi:Flp pilus assembly protein TadG
MSTRPHPAARDSDAGSATLELAVIAPVLLMLLSLVIVAGRVAAAAGAVDQAAAAAARAASLARDARSAQAEADRIARASLSDQGVTCSPLRSSVDTTGFSVAVGRPASVSVVVRCSVPLADLAIAGMPGTRIVSASAASPLDRFRGRG